MTIQFKGTSPFAVLADSLPLHARIAITLVAADLAISRLISSPNFPIAAKAFDLARRWYDGERFDPDQFEDILAHEYDKDLARCELEARSEAEDSAWLILEAALLYTALQAFRELGRSPTPLVSEVDDNILDDLDRAAQILSPGFMTKVMLAADILRQRPKISYERLKGQLGRAQTRQ